MGKYTKEGWYKKEIDGYYAEYGDLPPHWVAFPESHPYSMRWRMGSGETFVMVFSDWLTDNHKDEAAKTQYFLKYKPPPRWLETVAAYIWDFEEIEGFETSGYIEQLKQKGFEGTDKYVEDLESSKWLDK